MTRAQAENEIVTRCRAWLARAELSVVTDGTNPDVGSALAAALRAWQKAPADPSSPTDAEIDAVGSDDEMFFVAAELRTLETVWGNWARPNQSTTFQSQQLGALSNTLKDRINDLRQRLADWSREPSPAAAAAATSGVSVGTFRVAFQQPDCRAGLA